MSTAVTVIKVFKSNSKTASPMHRYTIENRNPYKNSSSRYIIAFSKKNYYNQYNYNTV